MGEPPDRLQSWDVVAALDIGDGTVCDLGLVGEVLDAPASVAPHLGDSDAEGGLGDTINEFRTAKRIVEHSGITAMVD